MARGINVPNSQPGSQGLATVNPIFTWVRLAQRVPVRIEIDKLPDGVMLVAGPPRLSRSTAGRRQLPLKTANARQSCGETRTAPLPYSPGASSQIRESFPPAVNFDHSRGNIRHAGVFLDSRRKPAKQNNSLEEKRI